MLLLLLLLGNQTGGEPTPRLIHQSNQIQVTNLSPAALKALAGTQHTVLKQMLQVYLAPAPQPDEKRPAILGAHRLDGDRLIFQPNFPFYPGHAHVARFDVGKLHHLMHPDKTAQPDVIDLRFSIPKPLVPPMTQVAKVMPEGKILPANLLRLYVHFSHSIQRGNSLTHIKLLDSTGKEVHAPFLNIAPELWDPTSKRLTVLFDPGRIKRGLVPHKELGPPLQPHQTYTLVIDQALQDTRGARLVKSYRKTFTTGPIDRQSPNPKAWRVHTPKAGKQGQLSIAFDEPLDTALALRMIHLEDSQGTVLEGHKKVLMHGKVLAFTPNKPWSPGNYRIHIDPRIEDLAGNQLNKLFDEDMKPARPHKEAAPAMMPFQIKPTN